MKVLHLSRYGRQGASSRYRTIQYLTHLRSDGFDVTSMPLLDDDYLARRYNRSVVAGQRVARAYLQRCWAMLRARRFDLVWLEKELLPWLPHWGEALMARAGVPVVVDYDDATFHRYDSHPRRVVRAFLGNKIDRVMCQATVVIAGNEYLAERARAAGARRVEILPTVIDLARYPRVAPPHNDRFTIGWIGTPVTAKYLDIVRPALRATIADGPTRCVAIGAGDLDWGDVPVEVVPWSEAGEVRALQALDVGIMPLPDSPWEWGKCGFKLVQYMAAARPVIASPIGVNREIVREGVNGFLATNSDEWVHAFNTLRRDPALRQTLGEAGRALVEEAYHVDVTAPRLARILRSAVDAGLGAPARPTGTPTAVRKAPGA
jgi:glycosyltransferase involved in cell wall biosynthesis